VTSYSLSSVGDTSDVIFPLDESLLFGRRRRPFAAPRRIESNLADRCASSLLLASYSSNHHDSRPGKQADSRQQPASSESRVASCSLFSLAGAEIRRRRRVSATVALLLLDYYSTRPLLLYYHLRLFFAFVFLLVSSCNHRLAQYSTVQ